MSVELTYEQWRAALEEASERIQDTEGARTTNEWTATLGWNRHRVLKFFRDGVHNGWVEVVWVKRRAMTGILHQTPAYRLKELSPPPAEKGKRKK